RGGLRILRLRQRECGLPVGAARLLAAAASAHRAGPEPRALGSDGSRIAALLRQPAAAPPARAVARAGGNRGPASGHRSAACGGPPFLLGARLLVRGAAAPGGLAPFSERTVGGGLPAPGADRAGAHLPGSDRQQLPSPPTRAARRHERR